MRKSYSALVSQNYALGSAKGQIEDHGGKVLYVLESIHALVFEAEEEAVKVIKTMSAISVVRERSEVLDTTRADADLGRHWLD